MSSNLEKLAQQAREAEGKAKAAKQALKKAESAEKKRQEEERNKWLLSLGKKAFAYLQSDPQLVKAILSSEVKISQREESILTSGLKKEGFEV